MNELVAALPSERLSKEYQLLLASGQHLPLVWQHAVPMLLQGKAYWEEFATLDSIHADLIAGKLQLWMVNNREEFVLAMLTQVTSHPVTKVLDIKWIGGERLDIAIGLFFDFVELWAARQGISSVQVTGRKGWVRKLKGRGYTQTRWVVSKNITGIREH